MSTQINVTVGSGGLSEQLKQQQEAARQAQLEKERQAKIEANSKEQREAKQAAEGKNANGGAIYAAGPGTPREVRRPAASRNLTGGVMAVQIGFPADYNPASPRVLVGPPGVTTNESTGTTAAIELLDIRPTPPGFGFPISGYGYASSGGSTLEWFMLPLTSSTCIAIRMQLQISAWYYFQVDGVSYTLLDSDSASMWQAQAFVVSKTKARQIELPATLEQYLKEVYPEMTLNSTVEYTGNPFFYPTIPPYILDTFSLSTWRDQGRYGNYFAFNDTLARQFGMGFLTGNHRASFTSNGFYTPAVYRFITGPMTIDSNSIEYAYMRSNYYPTAPNFYIGPCQITEETLITEGGSSYTEYTYPTCSAEKVGFDVTRAVPVDIDTGMDPASFVPKKAYDVQLNGANRNQLWYVWNWDKPNECRQQALALGFTAADLTP